MNRYTIPFAKLLLLASLVPFSQSACARQPAPAAAQLPAAVQAVAPAQVTGLPDFTALVERNAPAVVNIRATTTASSARAQRGMPPQEEVPEFFRRFFGPEFGVPGDRDRESGGSGFIISDDGYLLTNNHVVRGADQVTVRLTDRREFVAEVVGTDPATDIALLKIDSTGLPTVRMGDSNALRPGQWVVAIGSPFGFDYSVTAGVVSATGRSVGGGNQQYVPFIQTDVAINPGNSGGPLFNLAGEVVGINSQIFSGTGGYMGISFAIPSDVAQDIVDQIKSDGRVRRGLIGVQVQEVTREFAQSLGLERPAGALVGQVVADGAAEKAGIQVGDVILSFNGRPIESQADLPPVVGTTRPGTRAEVELFRDGRRRTVTVTVGEAPADADAVAAGGPEPRAAGAGRLGMALQDLEAQERSELGLGRGEGVRVTQVAGGAARRAGLQRGDVILRVGRTTVGSVADFDRAVAGVAAGDSVMLLVRRGASTQFIALSVREGD
ncbi:MAG: DegQ family serine endoprotease [Xanthomonadales bacterium]|nr:DegQ family serine endoprotease [Xanthomonadales bacterium]